MSRKHFLTNPAVPKGVLWVTALCAVMAMMVSPVQGANRVDISIPDADDTIRVCVADQFIILIENDVPLTGLSLGFKIWSSDPDNLLWGWTYVGGHGASGCVRDVPGSRLYPADSIFDLTGMVVWENDVDGHSPDTILVGGTSMTNQILPGPMQAMITMDFGISQAPNDFIVHTLCIDSVFVPPSGNFVFTDAVGSAIVPQVMWPSGGKCFPVYWPRCRPPVWDEGLPTSLTVPYTTTGTVTLSAQDLFMGGTPIFGYLAVDGGTGEAVLADHGDGTCDVSYTPTEDDIGRSITISLDVRSEYCSWMGCQPPYEISVTVTQAPLGLDCGWPYLNGATSNPMIKTDIAPINGEYYGELTYSIASGPGEIDPDSGTYTWTPGPTDIGQFPVEVRVAGSDDTATCTFTVDVVDENCCPGDANFSGSAEVGDAVFIINYVFRGGQSPRVPNWGDANADCMVNVGDAVRLIAYVFQSGPPPALGCVN